MGAIKKDVIIMGANGIGVSLNIFLLVLKLRYTSSNPNPNFDGNQEIIN